MCVSEEMCVCGRAKTFMLEVPNDTQDGILKVLLNKDLWTDRSLLCVNIMG